MWLKTNKKKTLKKSQSISSHCYFIIYFLTHTSHKMILKHLCYYYKFLCRKHSKVLLVTKDSERQKKEECYLLSTHCVLFAVRCYSHLFLVEVAKPCVWTHYVDRQKLREWLLPVSKMGSLLSDKIGSESNVNQWDSVCLSLPDSQVLSHYISPAALYLIQDPPGCVISCYGCLMFLSLYSTLWICVSSSDEWKHKLPDRFWLVSGQRWTLVVYFVLGQC